MSTHHHSWQANQPNQPVNIVKWANPHLPLAGIVENQPASPFEPYKLYEGMLVVLLPTGTIAPSTAHPYTMPIGIVYKSNVTPTGQYLDFEEKNKVTVTTYGLAEVRIDNQAGVKVGDIYKVTGFTPEGFAIIDTPTTGDWVSGILVKQDGSAFTGIVIPPFKF